jgi:lipid-binding SYLF domain-containing protein
MKQNLGHLSIENSTLARFSTAVGLSDKNLIQFVTESSHEKSLSERPTAVLNRARVLFSMLK